MEDIKILSKMARKKGELYHVRANIGGKYLPFYSMKYAFMEYIRKSGHTDIIINSYTTSIYSKIEKGCTLMKDDGRVIRELYPSFDGHRKGDIFWLEYKFCKQCNGWRIFRVFDFVSFGKFCDVN